MLPVQRHARFLAALGFLVAALLVRRERAQRRHRYRLLVHAKRALDVQDVIREWLGKLDWPSKARVTVDVDPYNFL